MFYSRGAGLVNRLLSGDKMLLYDSRYTGEKIPDALKVQPQVLYGPRVGRVLIPSRAAGPR